MVPRPELVPQCANALRAVCRGSAAAPDLARLIKLAAAVVCRRLSGRLGTASRFEGTTRDQLETSLVAGLFSGQEGESPIAEALADYLDHEDLVLYLRFQAVLVCAASQELFHRWHENDALSARLWCNLQRALRMSEPDGN